MLLQSLFFAIKWGFNRTSQLGIDFCATYFRLAMLHHHCRNKRGAGSALKPKLWGSKYTNVGLRSASCNGWINTIKWVRVLWICRAKVFFKVDKMAPKCWGKKYTTHRLHNWTWFGYNHEESTKYQKWKDHGVHRPRTQFTPLSVARIHLSLSSVARFVGFCVRMVFSCWYVLHLFHEHVYCLDPHLVSCIVQVESCWI